MLFTQTARTCIQPNVSRSFASWNSNTSSSFSVVQVSDVPRCFGIINVVMVNLLFFLAAAERGH